MKHLTIQVSDSSVRFTSIQDSSVLLEKEYSFQDKKDHRYKEQLTSFIEEAGLKNQEHDEHTISWSSTKTTLVPMNIFSESKPERIFQLCFGNDTPSNEIDYNRLSELGIVNVFEIPLWVKTFFILQHPRAIIQHESSMLIRGMFNSSTFKMKISLTVYGQHFLLMIAQQNKLVFYSVFDFQNHQDIIYHLMFTLQQKELLEESGELIWSEGAGANKDHFEDFQYDMKRIENLAGIKVVKDTKFIVNSHKLCV